MVKITANSFTKRISKTKVKRNASKKTDPALSQTIYLARKNPQWLSVAKFLSNSTRQYQSINLSDIEKKATPGDTILVLGKILSLGDITKKVRLCSLGISKPAKEKLKKTKSEWVSIVDEIKINPKMEGIKQIQ